MPKYGKAKAARGKDRFYVGATSADCFERKRKGYSRKKETNKSAPHWSL